MDEEGLLVQLEVLHLEAPLLNAVRLSVHWSD